MITLEPPTSQVFQAAPDLYVPAQSASSLEKPTVLIVEDDDDVHRGWAMVLRYRGYSVLSARDGSRGLEMIESERPDLVLLDLGLPGIHGLDVLKRMQDSNIIVPTVVISAATSERTGLEAHSRGASAVLEKPVDPNVLIPLIDELLQS